MVKGNKRNRTFKNPNGNFRPKRFPDNRKTSAVSDKIFIALDTCVLSDMQKCVSGFYDKNCGGGNSYHDFLRFLLNHSAITNNQFQCRQPFVFVVLPVVQKECENGEHYERFMKSFLKNNTVQFKLAQDQIENHIQKIAKLSNEFFNERFFLDKHSQAPSLDGAVVAEASKFGLTLVSRDHGITDLTQKQEHRVKTLSKKVFANGQQVVKLMGINAFRKNYNNEGYTFQKPINLDTLDLAIQRYLFKIDPTLEIDIKEVEQSYRQQNPQKKKISQVKAMAEESAQEINPQPQKEEQSPLVILPTCDLPQFPIPAKTLV